MKRRLPACLLIVFLTAGLAIAGDRTTIGPPFQTPPNLAPPIANQELLPQLIVPTFPPIVPPSAMAASPGACRSPERFWVDAELLLWWMKSVNLPPLITASPDGTPRADVGVLGVPGTSVLFGGPVNGGLTAGGRVTAGCWCNDEQTCGIEAYYFQLGANAAHAAAGTPGSVGRPFFNTATGASDVQLVSLPGFVDGTVQASASTGFFLGAGVLARANLVEGCGCRLDALIGYRYLSLGDNVGITENLTSTDPTQTVAPLGTNLVVVDSFHADNRFHGGDLGLTGTVRWNAWTFGGTARIAFGATQERVDINGGTSITVPGFPPVNSAGGLLALSSNIGAYSRNVFAVVPEARFQLAYDINPRARIHIGYSFLYWSQVVRAGEQIDLVVNPGLLPPPLPGATPLRPAFTFQGTSFWAQGIDLGLVLRF